MSTDAAKAYLAQAQALIAQALGELTTTTISGGNVRIKMGDDLQKAANNVPDGSTILVAPGTYSGITLTARYALGITIRPDTSAIPLDGKRNDPSFLPSLIRLTPDPNTGSALTAAPKSGGYTLIGVAPVPGASSATMIALGDDRTFDPLNLPSRLTFDRCILLADPNQGGKRGIAANCGALTVRNSYFDNFYYQDDSQCIAGWSGPGPFVVENNFLCATGEPVLFGGADAASIQVHPRNLTMRFNTCTKRYPSWMANPVGKTTKNAFELKAMFGALIEYNVFEYSWTSGQTGFLVVFTPRNQNGTAPFTGLSDIVFRGNIVRHGGAGFQILGVDDVNPSQVTQNLKITGNAIYDVDPSTYQGAGRCFQIIGGAKGIEIGHNTVLAKNHNSFMTLDGPKNELNVHDNVFCEGEYGMPGNNTGLGKPAWDAYAAAGSTFERNIIVPGTSGRSIAYPGVQNYFTLQREFVVYPTTGKLTERFVTLPSTDGKPIGCDIDDILQKTGAAL